MTDQNRRGFMKAATAFSIVPRHVLGGQGVVAPSDKITLGYIGTGTQGLREMMGMLALEDIRIVAVCDPCKEAVGYRDWSKIGLLNQIRRGLKKSDWRAGSEDAIPGGRDVGKDVVDTFYEGTGCAAYADFREMLEKEKDLTAVKIMTPDHLHAVISIAAMKRGKHVLVHKPLANRLEEAKMVIDTAREKGVSTHFIPWDANGSMEPVLRWMEDGSIGTLREVHNWTNRPVWPQYTSVPADAPAVPKGFDWDLWLGPEAERPYHPNYTHMVFRGWYDFGGGPMADMGHYSLWTVYNALGLKSPRVVEPLVSHVCAFQGDVPGRVRNDFAFPTASVVRFKYPGVDLIWYEGGMKPPIPEELEQDQKELPAEGMMFVGDKGKILAGFHVDGPRLIPERRMSGYPEAEAPRRAPREPGRPSPGMQQWIEACRGAKQQSPGSFLNAWPISEAVNLYAVALRTGKRLVYDGESRKITNLPEANQYLSRQYRKGWDPQSV